MAWLAEAAPGHVAEVLRVSDTGVTLPEYTTVAPIEGIVRRAGGILARIHQAGAPALISGCCRSRAAHSIAGISILLGLMTSNPPVPG